MTAERAVKSTEAALAVAHAIHVVRDEAEDTGLAPAIRETAIVHKGAHVSEQLTVGGLDTIGLMAVNKREGVLIAQIILEQSNDLGSIVTARVADQAGESSEHRHVGDNGVGGG